MPACGDRFPAGPFFGFSFRPCAVCSVTRQVRLKRKQGVTRRFRWTIEPERARSRRRRRRRRRRASQKTRREPSIHESMSHARARASVKRKRPSLPLHPLCLCSTLAPSSLLVPSAPLLLRRFSSRVYTLFMRARICTEGDYCAWRESQGVTEVGGGRSRAWRM